VKDSKGAAAVMVSHCPHKSEAFLDMSVERLGEFFLDQDSSGMGRMKDDKWRTWTSWLKDSHLLTKEQLDSDLFINGYFQ
jgi:hypothetical protein